METPFYNVRNDSLFRVSVRTRDNQYFLAPGECAQLSAEDVQFVNAKCGLIRTGSLAFDPEDAETLYALCRIPPRQVPPGAKQIRRAFLTHDTERVQQIIGNPDPQFFARARAIYLSLVNTGAALQPALQSIMERRYVEFSCGITKTAIVVALKPVQDVFVYGADGEVAQDPQTEKRETAEKPRVVCDICGKSYASEAYLLNHRRKAHPDA